MPPVTDADDRDAQVDRILAALPHRHPILLVDRVIAQEPGVSITALKAITLNEPCYAAVDTGAATYAYPSSLLIESWCQTAGILIAGDGDLGRSNDLVPLFGSIAGIRLGMPVHPGDLVRHEVTIERMLSTTGVVSGRSLVDGDVALTVDQVVVALRPRSEVQVQPAINEKEG